MNNRKSVSPVMGEGGKYIANGHLYAVDRQGKLLWPQAVKIREQHLVTGQGKELPTLVFATLIYEPQQANKPAKSRLAVLLIDKRTGRVVYEKPDFAPNYFHVAADPEKKTMQIDLQQNTVTLTFTDQPWPTKEELEKKQAEEKKKMLPKSLFNALKNAAEGVLKIPGMEEE